MPSPIFVLVLSQVIFSLADFLGRYHMVRFGFSTTAFLSPWFALLVLLHATAITLQLYVLSQVQLGRTMALFSMTSIIISNLLGFFLLQEILSPTAYVGVALALCAFLVLAMS